MPGSGRDNFNPVSRQVAFDNSTNGFVSTEAQSAIEEAKQNAEGFPRAGIRSCYNGTVSNNNWLGPNELLPNTPLFVAATKIKINEISWSNQTANVAFRIQFRITSRTGTIFYTLTVTSPNSGFGYATGVNYVLNPGDVIHAQYLDDGTNCSDMDLVLWISRTP